MDEELTRRIVAELARQHNRNDIIRMVCEHAGLEWPQAEQVVKQVEAEQAHTIARKQSPLLIFLSIGSILIGIALLYLGFDYVMGFFRGQALEELLSVRTGLYRIGGAVTGLGMIVGGFIGLYNTLLRYFET